MELIRIGGFIRLIKIKSIKASFENYFSKKYYDKVAVVKEYQANAPRSEWEGKSFEEQYQLGRLVVGYQNFEKNTKNIPNYFNMLTKEEIALAVFIGIIAYLAACKTDSEGKNIEQFIDKLLPKNYDVNNAFDIKEGLGHRVFGHDPITFGISNIPSDTLIKVKINDSPRKIPIKICDFLNIESNSHVCMWDIIWKFYGDDKNKIKGITDCLKHIIVHFAKDLFTPMGLPHPFLSCFEKYKEYENLDAHGIMYKDSLLKKFSDKKIIMKASDFVSFLVIETFIEFLARNKTGKDKKEFTQDMKLISMSTCLSLQMATIVVSDKFDLIKTKGNYTPGANVNALLSGAFIKIAIQEMYSVINARIAINNYYDSFVEERNDE